MHKNMIKTFVLFIKGPIIFFGSTAPKPGCVPLHVPGREAPNSGGGDFFCTQKP